MDTCMLLHVHMNTYVCTLTYIHVHSRMHSYLHAHSYRYIHSMHVHICICMFTYTRAYTSHICTYMYACTFSCLHVSMLAFPDIYIQSYMDTSNIFLHTISILTYIYMCTHINTFIQMYTLHSLMATHRHSIT